MPTACHRPLVCHPATPATAVRTFEAKAGWDAERSLHLHFCLRGDIARLRVPARHFPERREGLWEHTCFEAFVAVANTAAYREFNFSPSGDWAVFDFSDYRQRAADPAIEVPPLINTLQTDGRLELDILIAEGALPAHSGTEAFDIGLSAVVEAADTVDGAHSFWALRHEDARPDFHRRAGFILRLNPLPLKR